MQLQDKLWLFWRGGAWNPTFSYTTDGLHWVPARELVYFGHAQRPYTKYVTDGKRQIHGIFTDGHPENWKNSLHYARYENEVLYAMDGRRLGRSRTCPPAPPSSTTSTTTPTPAVAPGATTSP